MDIPNHHIVRELSSLKGDIHNLRKSALATRLTENPLVNDLEYLLGAFLEMYEPHLYESVQLLSRKGYLVDVSSGFSGKYSEAQSLNGHIPLDYVTRKKLEKIGIHFREFDGLTSLIFWPESADLEEIKTKWVEIMDILPDKGKLHVASNQPHAVAFRMKYVPEDKILQKKRLYERLLYFVQKETQNDLKNRKGKNSYPDNIEICLGTFVEGLEIQTRVAILLLTKKGYSIDASGFMDDPCCQMVEGDFQLEGNVVEKLKKIGVEFETNASGYSRLQFSPTDADLKAITKQWIQIASLLPKRREAAAPSMTKKARSFRSRYSD